MTAGLRPAAASGASEDGSHLERAGAYRTGNGLARAALGVRGGLPRGGFSLAVQSDAFLIQTQSDALTAASAGNPAAAPATATSVRAALKGSRTLRFAGRTLAPSVELGVRQDGGDAETGLGLERVETRADDELGTS